LVDPAPARKARGAFFTPPAIAAYLAGWAIRGPGDRVFEPSCGEASFLIAAGERLARLGGASPNLLHGVEIDAASARAADLLLGDLGLQARIEVGDFFDRAPAPDFDAVIGNPPYVRYQNFAGAYRAKALQAALSEGVRLTGLSSSWAAFTIHASRFLRPEGRLALVLPGELLTVNYAAQVRRFLLSRFGKVRLVMFETRVFPGVLEEVVLLLAEGQGGAPCFEIFQARGVDDLTAVDTEGWTEHRPAEGQKWTPALIASDAFAVYQAVSASPGFTPLLDWGETYLGAVTGNNDFFALGRAEAAALRLPAADLVAISPPGSRHLHGLAFSRAAWERLADDGARSFLFLPDSAEPSAPARRRIEAGRQRDVHTAYKCRTRTPWWRVPMVAVPDLLLTYMNQDRPRLIANEARVHILNSVYGVTLRTGRRRVGREVLPIACLNSLTLLGAEMVGRSYGGGMLKLEPKEADQLPVPSLATVEAVAAALRRQRNVIDDAVRGGDLARAVDIVDRIILSLHLGISDIDIAGLRAARDLLFQRRRARGKSRGKG
jgi:hypothetical protein